MSPLLVAQAPCDIKGGELGHGHFYRMASMWNVGGIKYQWWIMAQEVCFAYCLAFCFLTTMLLTTVAKISQLANR